MSGDVQPRKRKDKRRRKDELSFEEPRGTAAVFGEGDVFIHSHHEHGTGGHWCAKVIFFSLLAILVTLIGLIILENRGLSELEANSVESRYSGVLEGWLEDAPDDNHHDEHTLELKHHDEDDGDDEHGDITDEEHDVHGNEEDDEQADEADEDDDETEEKGEEIDEDDDDNSRNDEDDENEEENDTLEDEDDTDDRDQHDDDDDEDQALDSDEIEEDEDFRKYYENVDEEQHSEDDDEDDDENKDDDDHDYHEDVNDDENGEDQNDDSNEDYGVNSAEDNDDSNQDEDNDHQQLDDDDNKEEDEESNEYEESHATYQNEEEGDGDDTAEDEDIEVEKIEKEVSDEDVLEEVVASSVEQKQEDKSAEQSEEEEAPEEGETVEEDEFLEPEDIEEPVVVERITAPAGKPLPEVEEGTSTENPPDTLAEEEEYEKHQEELRRQKDQASHLWLKVAVGGALLVATHAVIQRATAPRDPSLGEHTSREDTPSAIDRRMTLIPEEPSIAADEPEEMPVIVKEVETVSTVTAKSIPFLSEKSEEVEEEELGLQNKNEETTEVENDDEVKELYSDDENEEEEEFEVEVEKPDIKESVQETKEKIKNPKEHVKNVEPDEEVPEDVEIIDEELLEEEIIEEEEEDEDDISDVDDAELLSRLEAKYGRLPEPERPAPKKDGGNSLEDEWPGEPSEQYWRQQLDEAERELRQGRWSAAERVAGAPELRGSARARLVRARALDAAAEARRDNQLLSQSIAAYLELLKMNERLSDNKLLEITNRTLDRIRFRGNYLSAEPVYRLLIRRFPDDPSHRNNLSISFLMANRVDLAEEVLRETLRRWPDDRVALAHLGFVLKTSHNKLEEAVDAMRKALEGDVGAANEPRFYFHLGDALLLLGRFKEAEEVHKRGAALGHFLSPAQRSLYNVERLKSRPWWNIAETPYVRLARNLEASWQTILKEGEAARALYEQEKEGLKERGEWSQLDIFVRGQEIPGRCKKAPVTCSIVRQELAAVSCKRGQIKFSAMEAGTHVRPHVGPTNCRLRMHLGLSNTKDTFIRVDKEIRQWQAGKVLMFDDSFEHEVWHNGTGSRLVLIVDVWHPDLTPVERRSLPAI